MRARSRALRSSGWRSEACNRAGAEAHARSRYAPALRAGPNPKLQRSSIFQTQTPQVNRVAGQMGVFGIWDLFGIWILGFGISAPHSTPVENISRPYGPLRFSLTRAVDGLPKDNRSMPFDF